MSRSQITKWSFRMMWIVYAVLMTYIIAWQVENKLESGGTKHEIHNVR